VPHPLCTLINAKFCATRLSVMLSGAGVQRSETPAESKHPYPKTVAALRDTSPLGMTSPQTTGLGLHQFLNNVAINVF
jgi:hypothetical protein